MTDCPHCGQDLRLDPDAFARLDARRLQLIKLVEIIHLDHTRAPFERCRAHACRLAQQVLKDPHA